jgi:hypothetical protein
MAGDTVRMAGNALMMVHDPWTMAAGNASDLRRQADLLDKVKGSLVFAYARKSGMPVADVEALMADETWLTAEEAVAFKLADEADAPLPSLPAAMDPRAAVREFFNQITLTKEAPAMVAPMTLERLRAEHGDLVRQIEAAERERIRGIEALELPGLGGLVAELKWREDVTPENAALHILAAEKQRRQQAHADRMADAPAPVADATQAPTEDRSKWPVERRAAWDWDHNPDIRAEFPDAAAYAAYLSAEARGAFRILTK